MCGCASKYLNRRFINDSFGPDTFVIVAERTDSEIRILGTEFIADRDSQEHTGQTTGCRHGDAEGLILENTVTTHGGAQARSTAGN